MLFSKMHKESTIHASEDNKMIGVYLPLPLFQYLTLYTLNKGISKSRVLREAVIDWKERNDSTESEEKLVDEIIESCKKELRIRKLNGYYDRQEDYFDQFKSEVKNALKSKGLSMYYIDRILEGLNEKGT
jgi:hypothetical protein